MSVIVLLIIYSIIVATGFLVAFIWAVKSGQFDDTSSPSVRILFEDKRSNKKEKKNKEEIPMESDKKEIN